MQSYLLHCLSWLCWSQSWLCRSLSAGPSHLQLSPPDTRLSPIAITCTAELTESLCAFYSRQGWLKPVTTGFAPLFPIARVLREFVQSRGFEKRR